MYNNSKKFLLKKEQEGKAMIFAPKNTTGWGRTERDPKKLEMMYLEGYNDAINRIDEVISFINNLL